MHLTRYYHSDVQTRGLLTVGDFQCKTLELPWKDNENRISCIRPGTYRAASRGAEESPSRPNDHIHLQGIEGRSWILIHAGNLYTHTAGCVLVGESFVDINADGHPDVTRSTETLSRLLEAASLPTSITIEEAGVPAGPVPTAEPEDFEVDFSAALP
ncbi:DUF5675 family protein [Salinibacter ruber]|uniref:DUF5675 family protein n=1 Tax=Salinibacter ruber TaxID=146919 RepID=UPI002072FC43|nr:DUF5675 family protein [Salinibacter ruber]